MGAPWVHQCEHSNHKDVTMRKVGRSSRVAALATAALVAFGGCAAGGGSLCEAAGGRYTAGTCVRALTPAQQAEKEQCQANGGVYLDGQDRCAVGGSGGP